MKRGELINLKWNDLDFSRRYIHIKEAKGGKSRRIPMSSFVFKLLNSLERGCDNVFYNPRLKRCLKEVKTGFKKACEDIGLPDLRFHDLRHTAATWI